MKFFAKILLLFIICISFFNCSSKNIDEEIIETPVDTSIYFPPNNSNVWETTTVSNLGWNQTEVQPLLNFLETKNTKSFIILHNGKIVIEEYFNNHDANKAWYWASAGKTLTSTITGIAQDEELLNGNNKVSDYLENGWTSASLEKENLITVENLLKMDSGLDDSLGEDISKENLKYKEDASSRWAYHNVYVKLQDVVAQASNSTWDSYFNSKLKDKIGMSGAWINTNDFNVFWSNSRSMARFGLLIAANGKWNDTQIISENFLNKATNTSQNINLSYGYLWWLNGKNSYHLPQTQVEFSGSLIPNAPNDLFAALGKNDQKIYVVPSKNIVIIRMGEAGDSSNFALSTFDNELWEKINAVID